MNNEVIIAMSDASSSTSMAMTKDTEISTSKRSNLYLSIDYNFVFYRDYNI